MDTEVAAEVEAAAIGTTIMVMAVDSREEEVTVEVTATFTATVEVVTTSMATAGEAIERGTQTSLLIQMILTLTIGNTP